MNLFKGVFRKLFPARTVTDFPSGYIPHRFVMERIEKGPVLVVGDYEGRDYPSIREKVGEAYLLDIVDTGVASGKWFLKQSVTEPIPFADDYFHMVVVGEVIEHVWEDKAVLEEIRRVLAPDGVLLLTIPFLHDFPEYHYHIYSPRTVVFLLAHAGFGVEDMQYRGLAITIPNVVAAFFALLLFPLFGEKSLEFVNRFIWRLHILLSRSRRINSLFRFERGFKHYGALIVATKSEKKVDSVEVQRKAFDV